MFCLARGTSSRNLEHHNDHACLHTADQTTSRNGALSYYIMSFPTLHTRFTRSLLESSCAGGTRRLLLQREYHCLAGPHLRQATKPPAYCIDSKHVRQISRFSQIFNSQWLGLQEHKLMSLYLKEVHVTLLGSLSSLSIKGVYHATVMRLRLCLFRNLLRSLLRNQPSPSEETLFTAPLYHRGW